MAREQSFAAKLRWWRQRRGWSQLDLAGRAEISQRHLSFLELGRASPSRDMVVRLAQRARCPPPPAQCVAARRGLCAGLA